MIHCMVQVSTPPRFNSRTTIKKHSDTELALIWFLAAGTWPTCDVVLVLCEIRLTDYVYITPSHNRKSEWLWHASCWKSICLNPLCFESSIQQVSHTVSLTGKDIRCSTSFASRLLHESTFHHNYGQFGRHDRHAAFSKCEKSCCL